MSFPSFSSLARGLSLISATFLCAGTLLASSLPSPRPTLRVSEELFNPQLQPVTTLDEAVERVSASVGRNPTPAEVARAADTFVRNRFADGYSHFRFIDNWLAYLAGFAWDDLKVPVLPDDILHYRRAACSQQAIVFQAIIARFGLDYASVTFPGHYASAALIDGKWTYFDPHLEADQQRLWPVSALRSSATAKALYGKRPHYAYIRPIAPRASITHINEFPAPQAAIFHRATSFLSRYGFILLLGAYAVLSGFAAVGGARNKLNEVGLGLAS